jgi:hypothetical protein
MNWAMHIALLALSPFGVSDDMATRIHAINFFFIIFAHNSNRLQQKNHNKNTKIPLDPLFIYFYLKGKRVNVSF